MTCMSVQSYFCAAVAVAVPATAAASEAGFSVSHYGLAFCFVYKSHTNFRIQ